MAYALLEMASSSQSRSAIVNATRGKVVAFFKSSKFKKKIVQQQAMFEQQKMMMDECHIGTVAITQ